MQYKLFVFDLDETLWTVSEGLCSLIKPPYHRRSPDRIETDEGFWVELKPGVRRLFEALAKKLSRMDARDAPWTTRALELIRDRPGERAGNLAPEFGWETPRFKTQVRKLKAQGLTESLEVGYRLSPRGEDYLARLYRTGA